MQPMLSPAKKQKRDEEYEEGEGIDKLPDHILVSIISLLPMNEAARSSILSRKWRYLWTYYPRLNFDSESVLDNLISEHGISRELNVERVAYANWVNQVLRSYNGVTIEVFRIRFSLNLTWRNDIDRWVNFAMQRKVNMFELNLLSCDDLSPMMSYSFPTLEESNCYSSLTVIKLALDVTGEVLESFLCNCPCLERLCVLSSQTLVGLRVRGSSLQLKHLEIRSCFNVKSLQISAPNLLSFNYCGPIINMPLENTPKLVDITLSGPYGIHMKFHIFQLSHFCARLQKMTLDVMLKNASTENIHVVPFPNFNNLKELVLITMVHGNGTLLGFTPLLINSPLLQKLSLEVHYLKYVKRPMLEIQKTPLNHMKEVEITGFAGRPVEMEFILFLTNNAFALEKLVLDTRECDTTGKLYEPVSRRKMKARKRRARRFQASIPKTIEIVIP